MTVLELTAKQQLTIVDLEYGSSILPKPGPPENIDDVPTIVRLTDNTTDAIVDGETYLSVPEMQITLPAQTGFLEEAPCKILIPETAIDIEIVSGPFAPVRVTVRSSYRKGSIEDIYHFVGKLQKTVRNYRGKDGQALLQCVSWKSTLKVRPSLIATHQCQWPLFGKGCQTRLSTADLDTGPIADQGPNPSLGSAISDVVVESISGQTVTLSDVPIITDKGKYWHAGFLEHRGLRLKIIDWDEVYFGGGGDEISVTLAEMPPPSWLNSVMRLLPGCDQFVETCEDRWNNLPNFSGVGYGMLTYNPIIENGC